MALDRDLSHDYQLLEHMQLASATLQNLIARIGKLLAEAEYWEHLAEAELSSHFEECNPTESKALELRPAA